MNNTLDEYHGYWSDDQFKCTNKFYYYVALGGDIVKVTEVIKGKDKKSNWNDARFVTQVTFCLRDSDLCNKLAEPHIQKTKQVSNSDKSKQDVAIEFKFQLNI